MTEEPQRTEAAARDVLTLPLAYLRLTASVIESVPELDRATRDFEPVPGAAGESVATWLRERALRDPQQASVRVRRCSGRITGVYALCAAQVALAEDAREQLGGVHYRTQPAVLLAQLARASEPRE